MVPIGAYEAQARRAEKGLRQADGVGVCHLAGSMQEVVNPERTRRFRLVQLLQHRGKMIFRRGFLETGAEGERVEHRP